MLCVVLLCFVRIREPRAPLLETPCVGEAGYSEEFEEMIVGAGEGTEYTEQEQ